MKGTIAIFFALPMGAMCTDPTTCAMSYMKYKSSDNCCEDDNTKCGPATTVDCGAGKYKDATKYGAATGADAVAACCTAMSTCAAMNYCNYVTVNGAHKEKSGVANSTMCDPSLSAGDASSCVTTCCELDTTKCGGTASTSQTCSGDNYWDPTKRNVAVAGAAATNCCTAKVECGTITCSAAMGYKVASAATNSTKCPGSAVTCTIAAECCELDTTICASMRTADCGTGKVKDTTVAGSTARGNDGVATCCKTAPAATNAPVCAGTTGTSLTSGAAQLQWKAMNVIVAITGAAAALWK